MKHTLRISAALVALLAMGILTGCQGASAKSPEVADGIRKSIHQAGYKNITVSQDREKGVVTLGGQAASENEKAQAETLARSMAGTQVVANQIAVLPVGSERDARAMNLDLDKGIEQNLDAALILNKLHDNVKYAVSNSVVTLTGEANSDAMRTLAEQVAAAVPNVKQVVNDLQVKNQKASSGQ